MKHPTKAEARLDLALLEAEADAVSSSDLYLWLRESGLPPEVAMRLKILAEFTIKVGQKLLRLGKILLLKLIEFIKINPNLAIGIALGAATSVLISMVPFLGPILAPIALPLGIAVGAIAGNRLDRREADPTYHSNGWLTIPEDIIDIARKCLMHLIEMFMALKNEFKDLEFQRQ